MSKWLLVSLMAMLFLSSFTSVQTASASSLNELKQQKENLEKKKTDLNSNIKVKESEINTNNSSIESIMEQIKTLHSKVEETNDHITRVESEIKQTTTEIEELQISIVELETKIKERNVVLRERVRSMQINGGNVNYLDVLLGANDFADFIDRISAVTTLVDADRSIMTLQAEDQKKLEEEQALVEKKLTEQENNKKELQDLKNSLESQKKEKDGLVRSLEAKQADLNIEKGALEHLFDETNQMSKETEQEIISEQKRIEEIARAAAAAAEKKRQEAAAATAAEKKSQEEAAAASAKKNQSSSVPKVASAPSASSASSASSAPKSSNTPKAASASVPAPSVSGGTWTRPAAGRLTSSFGWRIHPISKTKKQHRGMDIANSVGTKVVAAGAGVVSRAQYHNSYGNHVMITHIVNGKVYTTVYAHLSSLGVSAGQTVSKGQFIGNMGSTGSSTGPHLHLEMHVGHYSGSGSSAVNPLSYIPF